MNVQHDLPLPPSDCELGLWPEVRITQCAGCGELVHGSDILIGQYYQGTVVTTEHFCGRDCYHSWFVSRLRSFGL